MGGGRAWDRWTGGPGRRQRQMLRKLEELDRLDAAAGGVGLGTTNPLLQQTVQPWRGWSPTPPRRRRIPSLAAIALLTTVVGVTAALVYLRNQIPQLDDHAVASVVGPDRPTGLMATSTTRLVPPPQLPAGTGGYSFMVTNDRGPAAWDACRPVNFVMNESISVPGASQMVLNVLDMASTASGLQLTLEGPTPELATADRAAMDRQLYGNRWSPVLIAWTDPAGDPRLAGDVAGIGGGRSLTGSNGRLTYVSGIIHLDAPAFREILARPNGQADAEAIIAHEVGHVLGLGHVDDAGQLMGARTSGQKTFGDGDRRGLAILAGQPCQFEF